MNPERVGPYLIDKKVGAGGMGTVYRAHHEETGDTVAVKVLPASLAREGGFVSRFEREIEAMKKVQNKNIVEFYDNGKTEDGTYYLAMEFVDGETLTRLLGRKRKLPWREVIDLTTQICSALKAAHNSGVVHRDLKPSNLMIREDGVIKLTDFGVAHVFASTRLTKTGGIVGTAEYMSPEQAAGKRTTKRSDLYSLGAVMYVMLTGRPPFTGQTASDITHKHIYGQFDLPSRYSPDIPNQLEIVLLRLMEKDPEERFPDAFVTLKALEAVRGREDYVAQQAGNDTIVLPKRGFSQTVIQGSAADVTDHPIPAGPGSATMMRDLMREEIERANKDTPISRALNNIWVLLALLALVIAGGFYFLGADDQSPEARFAEGEALMANGPGNGWLRARTEFFEPLIAEDKETWEPQVQSYLAQIEQYANSREFARGRKPLKPPKDEPTRLLSQVVQLAEDGDLETARTKVNAVIALLEGQEQYEYLISIAKDLQQEIQPVASENLTTDFVSQQMQLAESLHQDENPNGAAQIYLKLIDLYSESQKTAVVELIRECSDRLEQLSEQQPEQTDDGP
ncbi:MAG: serine/threonine protein kinase [Planctomycetaceae bacterium]